MITARPYGNRMKKAMMMKIILITPLGLAILLFIIVTTIGVLEVQKFDPIGFYFNRKIEFTLAFILVIAGQIPVFYHFVSESQRKIAGKWSVTFNPIVWKGKKVNWTEEGSKKVIGKGYMNLSRSFHSDVSFNGYMYVEYFAEETILAHYGFYEINLVLSGKEVSGSSLMLEGERLRGDLLGPSDMPGVNPCIYTLRYFEDEGRLVGKAEMEKAQTISKFVAIRF